MIHGDAMPPSPFGAGRGGGSASRDQKVGIGHAGQPNRLQAICRSRARRMRLEFPAHPLVRPGRGFNSATSAINKNAREGASLLIGGGGGN